MKTLTLLILVCLGVSGGGPQVAFADDTVTIPKSRLEELQRKEAELEKLKGGATAQTQQEQLATEKAAVERERRELEQSRAAIEARAAAMSTTTVAVIVRDTPAIESLPPLGPDEVVNAMDLMHHYRSSPKAAKARYEKSRIRVEGEIAGFDKPLFVRTCSVLLKTTERNGRVACRVDPPEGLPTIYTASNGEELAGTTTSGARSSLARVGQRAIIEGWCKGLDGQDVKLTSAKLISAR